MRTNNKAYLLKETNIINYEMETTWKVYVTSGNIISFENTTYKLLQRLYKGKLDVHEQHTIFDREIIDKLLTITIGDNLKSYNISVMLIDYDLEFDFYIDFYAFEAYSNIESYEYLIKSKIDTIEYKPFVKLTFTEGE